MKDAPGWVLLDIESLTMMWGWKYFDPQFRSNIRSTEAPAHYQRLTASVSMCVKINNSQNLCADQYVLNVWLEMTLKFSQCKLNNDILIINGKQKNGTLLPPTKWIEDHRNDEGMIRAPYFEKGHCRASKTEKKSWLPLSKSIFWAFKIK